MARYVVLLQFTDQGARQIKDSTTRAHSFAEAARKSGVIIENQLWLLGYYDGLLVLSAESERHALRCVSELAALGYVRTKTLQAFDDEEFNAIIQ